MNYQSILFDADGTLFDYDRAEFEALSDTFKKFGYDFDPSYVEKYEKINKQIWLQLEQGKITPDRLKVKRFEELLSVLEIQSNANGFSDSYLDFLSNNTSLIHGAEELLKTIVGKVRLVLITNGLKKVQRSRFAKSTIGSYFDHIIISEEVGAAKPDKKIFDVTFSKMNYPEKDTVLIVGDSLTSDIKGGADYGIDTCWFNPKHLNHDHEVLINYEINELEDVLKII